MSATSYTFMRATYTGGHATLIAAPRRSRVSAGIAYACFLLVILLQPGVAPAQATRPDARFWMDAYNIRHHLDARGLGLEDFTGVVVGPTTVVWDSVHRSYRSTIPSILRYGAISGSSYTRVTVRQVSLINSYRDVYSFEHLAPRFPGLLDTLLTTSPLRNRLELRYDTEGRLLERIAYENDTDTFYGLHDSTYTAYVRLDTNRLSYACTSAGRLHIRWQHTATARAVREGKAKNESLFFSTCCGHIRGLPYVQRNTDTHDFELDDGERLTGEWQQRASFANECRYEPCGAAGADVAGMVAITNDRSGRVLSRIAEVPGQPDRLFETVVYEDGPVNNNFHPFWMPLMQQYLQTIDSPWMTTARHTQYSYDTSAQSPQRFRQTIITVQDKHGNPRLSLDSERYAGYGGIRIFKPRHDSAGPYYTEVWLYGVENNMDDVVYNPQHYRESHELTGGDYHPTIWEIPQGTFKTGHIFFSDRTEQALPGGSRLIAYGPKGGYARWPNIYRNDPLDYWAPQQDVRYASGGATLENFVLLDARGLVRYVYSEGQLYGLAYE